MRDEGRTLSGTGAHWRVASFVDAIIHFVTEHHYLAYGLVFLCALLEAAPVIGAFVPGSGIIIAISAVVAAGGLDLTAVMVAAFIGGLLGDGSAFLIGRIYQARILMLWPLSAYPTIVTRSETFFAQYGLLAILVARFVPPIRAFIPVIAGTLGMSPARFFPVNVVAVMLWACAHILPGALAGSLWRQYGKEIEHVALPILAVVIIGGTIVWALRRRRALS